MSSSHEMHVLIIGAGLTGLIIAHGLAQAGIPYTLFETEEASTFRPREWTMMVHWGLPLLEELLPSDPVSRLREAYVDSSIDFGQYPNNCGRVFNGVTGELIKEVHIPGRMMKVSRRKLRALCSEGVGVEVEFGQACRTLLGCG